MLLSALSLMYFYILTFYVSFCFNKEFENWDTCYICIIGPSRKSFRFLKHNFVIIIIIIIYFVSTFCFEKGLTNLRGRYSLIRQ